MDYAPFFAQSPQPFFHMSIPPTPSYSGDDPKLGPTDPIDATMFAQNPFDTFRFSSGLPQDDLISAGDGMHIVGSVDSGLGNDGMGNDGMGNDGMGNDGMGNDGLDFLNQGENSYQHDRRSSSEEKDNLTPAQSRRKAQNRAAQRAFRERKERHVKDLEAKLNALESSASSLASDNQRLKLALQRATTENEILRASSRPSSTITPAQHHSPLHNTDTSDALLDPGYTAHSPAHGTHDGDGTLLPAGATWDLIQNHPLVQQGFVDIAEVCDRLRGAARCDGSGPVFAEKEVIRAVELSRRAGGDELI